MGNPLSTVMGTMSNQFSSRIANVYFTKISNVSKFQKIRKSNISNTFKETLMSKELKLETTKLTCLARNLRENSFSQQRRDFCTNTVFGFHQRNPPGQSKPNRSYFQPTEPLFHGDGHFVEGTCYVTIVFSFIVINLVNLFTLDS